jgi:hypothetical protein
MKNRFRILGREAGTANFDKFDQRESQDWSSETLHRDADEVERFAKLKREALAISELVEKQQDVQVEPLEAKALVRKYQEKMEKWEKIREMAREIDDD